MATCDLHGWNNVLPCPTCFCARMDHEQADSTFWLGTVSINSEAANWVIRYGSSLPVPAGYYGEQCADTDGTAMVADESITLTRECVARMLATEARLRGAIHKLEARIIELDADGTLMKEVQRLEERMFHFIGEVKIRDERIMQLEAERDTLRTELAQRMAIPARALRNCV